MSNPYIDPSAEIRRVRRLGALLGVLTVMLIVVLGLYLYPLIRDRFFLVGGPRAITPRGELMEVEKTTIALFKQTSPSVVFITVDTKRTNPFSRRPQDVPEGSGSGFIWDEQGHVITNYHVIQNASAAHVILSDQTTYDADVVGASPQHDLAVLKITVPLTVHLIPIPLGESRKLQVGQSVFAIGNPFGLDQTLTTGVISALNRTISGVAGNTIPDVIQTDAAINPGNSGGPLLDSAGRLIGVNTAIFSQSGGWSGIGFATPADTANRVIPQIIEHGKYQPARIGVSVDSSLQALLPKGVQGLPITAVDPGSPADKMQLTAATIGRGRGFRPYWTLGDVILQINDKPIKSASDLYNVLDSTAPGDTLTVTLWNNAQTRQVKIKTE